GDARRDRPAHHQSRQSVGRNADRSGAACRAQARDRYRIVEFVRLRRDQCLVDLHPLCGLTALSPRPQAFAIILPNVRELLIFFDSAAARAELRPNWSAYKVNSPVLTGGGRA